MPVKFPPVEEASEDGLLAIGGELDQETLLEAYKHGVFPWPVRPDYPMTWFSPNPRGIIDFENFKVGRTLAKFLKKNPYSIKFNHDFDKVIQNCSQTTRKHEVGTWIHPIIIKGYSNLFQQKLAYCVSVYDEEELVGGLYGVCIGEIISGESMFHTKSNASKVALVGLINKLKTNGIKFIDTQMVTPVIESFGGENIPRQDFIKRINRLDLNRTRDEIFL